MEVVGVVLTGGQSRRMGSPKAQISLEDGRPVLVHLVEALLAVCPRVVICGSDHGVDLGSFRQVSVLPDAEAFWGPVAALSQFFHVEPQSSCLLTACDQPLLSTKVLAPLLQACPPEAQVVAYAQTGSFCPFPAIYTPNVVPILQAVQKSPKASFRQVFAQAQVTEIPLDETQALANMNTPFERDRLLALRVR